ncbi:MAG: hypothetical protein HRU51_02730 [Xanthomonadales bacterium]|nr:hypothetical protein [Xanthomonadales bacterium]
MPMNIGTWAEVPGRQIDGHVTMAIYTIAMRAIIITAGLFTLLATRQAGADDEFQGLLAQTDPLPRNAILRNAQTDLEQWVYTRSRLDEGRLDVDEHDPRRPGPEHWRLLSIDGETPNAAELKEYAEWRADHSEASDDQAGPMDILELLVPGSVRLLGSEGDVHEYGYAMRSPDGKRKKVYAALAGAFTVVPGADTPFVSLLRIWNREPVRPRFGLRINAASLDLAFTEQAGYVLPQRVEVAFEGSFLLVKTLDERFEFTLDNFQRIEPPARPDPVSATTSARP